MALILCLETATKACSVALGQNGQLIARRESLDDKYSHSEKLNPFIEEMLQSAGVDLKELDAVAISKGPGSYTGLRIGTSSAKGLCYALDIPLIAVDTLRAMADGMRAQQPAADLYCPMIDARRMEVYTALYNSQGEVVEPVAAKIIDENSFATALSSKAILFFGDGAPKCKEVLNHKQATVVDGFHPSAAFMLELAEQAFANKTFEDTAYFEPYYLKDFVAGKPKKLL